jgi:Reverse transcriptase (RNA-dependent DNA polymerase)
MDIKRSYTVDAVALVVGIQVQFDTDDYLTKFKARLCIRGDLQSTEQDTYAATLAAHTFRALMAIAAAFNLEIQQYDAVNAFVNSKLNEDIYCYSPEGFERQGSCWHLLRAFYGLKQSPLLWYTDFTAAIEELGLHPIPGINCLYANDHLLLFFYVDDIAILYSKQHHDEFKQFKHGLLQRFEMRSLGNLTWFLGIRIKREHSTRKAWLCQDSYISKIATKFNVNSNSKAPQTLLPYEELRTAVDGKQATAQQILAY